MTRSAGTSGATAQEKRHSQHAERQVCRRDSDRRAESSAAERA
jgi:hypothetical protein